MVIAKPRMEDFTLVEKEVDSFPMESSRGDYDHDDNDDFEEIKSSEQPIRCNTNVEQDVDNYLYSSIHTNDTNQPLQEDNKNEEMIDATIGAKKGVDSDIDIDSATEEEVTTAIDMETDERMMQETNQRRDTSAIVVAGIAGCAVGGIIGGLVLGVSTGVVVHLDRGGNHGHHGIARDIARDIARALGDIGLTAEEKAKEVEHKHHLLDKTKQTVSRGWERMKEKDTHHYWKRSRESIVSALTKVSNYEKQHKFVDNVAKSFKDGITKVVKYEKQHKFVDNVTKSFKDGIAFMANPYERKN